MASHPKLIPRRVSHPNLHGSGNRSRPNLAESSPSSVSALSPDSMRRPAMVRARSKRDGDVVGALQARTNMAASPVAEGGEGSGSQMSLNDQS
ncbi:hypothetical protein PM082_001793 [Marasmius tenuissimus]|nr:hypothetical protein PM082_001793 [Marasmius tenuissimus]